MKKIVFILLATILVFSCKNNQKTNSETTSTTKQKEYVEILYFHGKQRCITCNTIEKLSKEIVEQNFAQQIKDGKVIFKTVDISTSEGEKMADKYEVTWSSLFINKWKDGKETKNNMTDFSFSNVQKSPDTFKTGIKKKIEELLK